MVLRHVNGWSGTWGRGGEKMSLHYYLPKTVNLRFLGISAFGRAEIIFVACNFIGTRTYFCGFGSQIGGTVLVSVGDCRSPV